MITDERLLELATRAPEIEPDTQELSTAELRELVGEIIRNRNRDDLARLRDSLTAAAAYHEQVCVPTRAALTSALRNAVDAYDATARHAITSRFVNAEIDACRALLAKVRTS